MRSVLIAGLPGHFGTWLAERLPGISVQVAFSADEAEEQAVARRALLLMDTSVGAEDAVLALRRLRAGAAASVPVIVTADVGAKGVDERLLDRLVKDLRVDRLLFHPLDRAELLRAVTALLASTASSPAEAPPTPTPTPDPVPASASSAAPSEPPRPSAAAGPGARDSVTSALGQLWPRAKGNMLERIGVLEQAARAASDGRLVGALRQRAADEAHRLAGALGTFGLGEGTRIARELETRYAGGEFLTRTHGAALAEAAGQLRAMVESAAPAAAQPAASAAPAPASAGATLLVLTTDEAVAVAARHALDGGPVRLAVAADLPAAPPERPLAVLLDVASGGGWAELHRVAGRHPGVAVIVAMERGDLPDRLRAVQLGARGFVEKPLTPEAVRDALSTAIPAAKQPRPRLLCVDDDPALLLAVRGVLEPRGMEVHTLDDPLRFWTRLGEVEPDLLVLDIEMPHVNGIELCRVVRADPRRRALPVVFLTARAEPETVYRVFAAGADDFVAKPFVGPELVARIESRVFRSRAG